MKIGIIGGGSIGLLFAGYLGKVHDVTLLVRREKHMLSLMEKGVTILHGETSIKVKVKATTSIEEPQDMYIVTVKEYDLGSIEEFILKQHRSTPLMFVQNGIGHIDWMHSLPHANLIAATVEHGALKENDVTVRHLGRGKTNISLVRGKWGAMEELLNGSNAAFPFVIKSDYEEMLLSKLFINVLINPLTAVARVTNGKLADNPDLHQMQKDLFQELLLLFPHMDGVISFEDVMAICRNTYYNRSSMLKDIESKRKTEIESILGVLLKKAHEETHFVPIMNALYRLVKGIEREGLGG
ncbi:2-dehydropantoate 2-reductase [Bacillus sp. KH172YL63]|uniref:2-dehydropantoate 2-reductase n=1 Tax=Bacillus sp. KH172YL63 TaxID=2709784 RepID=UPI0013E50437|nr:2-dehydropantoate 2-reductase [Bacillus sp. KH172YL63]BCB03252.1 putative 2-dehydropantoate 2-reductase [Bacillus sp. KH172YL63]